MKTIKEILRDCDNENDRKLLEKSFLKMEKEQNKINKIMGSIIILIIVGVGGFTYINEYFILLLFPMFVLMFWAMKLNLEGAGLF